ncbi:MAG: sensor histidine kinase, partial [Gelidibacter sp.]|nr:sensor histidine kinase [Gelidibacter sp.]
DDVKLSIDESIPCGLLINEVITNAIKHAFPNDRKGEIKIEMSEHDAKITLKISDNGIGLSEEIQPDNQDSFGFLLIYTLAEQLEAKMKVYNENGLSFTFQWKHKNYQMLS